MATLAKLKLSTVARKVEQVTAEQHMRQRMLGNLAEQLGLARALVDNTVFTVTQTRYTTDENGQRKAVEHSKRLRSWFWHDLSGKWYLELRYGSSVLNLAGDKSSIEVGLKEKLVETIETVIEAVAAGELDAAMKKAVAGRKVKKANDLT
jgi:hypothetical protein